MRNHRLQPPAAIAVGGASDQGLEGLYRRYAGWLTGMLRRRFGASLGDTVEDLVQETYLRVAPYEAAGRVRRPQALLLNVASNLARDELRRRAVRRGGAAAALAEPVFEAHADPDQVEALFFKDLVLSMPQPYRDVFVLSRIAGLTYEEIAAHSGLSIKTVEWRMSRALAYCAARVQD